MRYRCNHRAGYIYCTLEYDCSRKNERLENTSCVSTWEKDGMISILMCAEIICLEVKLDVLILVCIQVEMTGDYTPDLMALTSANIIISTPEKWDGISRNWHSRSYVTKVCPFCCQAIVYRHYLCIAVCSLVVSAD